MDSFAAPIFMLPVAGMVFLAGAIAHQIAGMKLEEDKGRGAGWIAATIAGLALQGAAVAILVSV